jgi:hypothetical protein
MLHMVEQATAVAAASGSSQGHANVAIVGLLMAGALIGIVALVAAKRLWAIELLFTGVFFTLLGGSPVGRALWDWLWSLGG